MCSVQSRFCGKGAKGPSVFEKGAEAFSVERGKLSYEGLGPATQKMLVFHMQYCAILCSGVYLESNEAI